MNMYNTFLCSKAMTLVLCKLSVPIFTGYKDMIHVCIDYGGLHQV